MNKQLRALNVVGRAIRGRLLRVFSLAGEKYPRIDHPFHGGDCCFENCPSRVVILSC